MGFFPWTAFFTNMSFVDSPNPLTAHSYHLHTLRVFVGKKGLTSVQISRYLQPRHPTVSLCISVKLCSPFRSTFFHLYKVPGRLPSYTLRTGTGRTDSRDVYGIIRYVPMIVVFGVGTQLPRRPVMMRRLNAAARGGCYLFPSNFVCTRVG